MKPNRFSAYGLNRRVLLSSVRRAPNSDWTAAVHTQHWRKPIHCPPGTLVQ